MPTYEYQCKSCNWIQEEMHSIKDTQKIICAKCGSLSIKKFSLNTNFILKGSDWPDKERKTKKQMTDKNKRMKSKMVEREKSGEAVKTLSDLKK